MTGCEISEIRGGQGLKRGLRGLISLISQCGDHMNAKTKEPRQERRQARWVLAALDKRGWVNPALLAILADYPIRVASSWLRRLHRWGFVQRRHNAGLALYAISERGRLMGRLRRK